MNTHVDIIGANGRTQGDVANSLTSNGKLNFGSMRPWISEKDGRTYVTTYVGGDPKSPASYSTRSLNTNATLRRDEWKTLDSVLIEAARYRLGGVADLVSNGLTYQLGNAMGTTVLEWHDVSDGMVAEVTMDGITRADNDRPEFQTNYLPIPIIHSDYEINARELAASRSLGNPLDTTMAEQAARRVLEKLENMLFTDTDFAFGAADDRSRNKIYSYLNFPDRNAVTLSIHWDHSAMTPAGIIQDVQDMLQSARDAYHHGPFMLYIPSAYERVLSDDYDVSGSSLMTIRERILKFNAIKDIKVIDTLTADNVVLVQMTPDVVRLVQGLGLQNVEWKTEGNFLTKFKVLTIQVPQLRSDQNGKCGIVHLS